MNVVKRLFCVFILAFCFSSCKNEAVDFNNSLVTLQKSVLTKVQDFGKKMKQVDADSLPAADVKPQTDSIVLFIDNKIKEAQNLSTPKDGERLKAAILKQLAFEREIVSKIGRLSLPDLPGDERLQIETEFLNSQNTANELEDSVRVAQEGFARQYNFRLQDK